jgi:ribosome-associated protein
MHKIQQQVSAETLCNMVVEGMQENKAEDITVLDLRQSKGAVSDFFIICSANSATQVNGIADSVVRFTRKNIKERPWHIEGKANAEWVLLDYVSVVAHIFYKETRSFYNLEDMWADAQRTDITND